jgi:hypothetical protein
MMNYQRNEGINIADVSRPFKGVGHKLEPNRLVCIVTKTIIGLRSAVWSQQQKIAKKY